MLKDGLVAANGDVREVIDLYLAEMSSLGRARLDERKDRSGTGEIIATKIEAIDAENKPIPQSVSGQSVRFRMHYRCSGGAEERECRGGIVFRRGEHLCFVLSTWIAEREPLRLFGEGYIDFCVAELPLAAGSYAVDSFLESHELFDAVGNAAEIEVVDGDFYGTGRLRPSPHWKDVGVLIRQTCSHVNKKDRQACMTMAVQSIL